METASTDNGRDMIAEQEAWIEHDRIVREFWDKRRQETIDELTKKVADELGLTELKERVAQLEQELNTRLGQ